VKILLIQLKRIGDLVLTTPAIAALREKFPDAQLTLVISRECVELLPAITGVDRTLIVYRGLKDAATFLAIARSKFDYCVDLSRNDRSAFLTFLSRAKKRIVSYRVKRRTSIRRHAYNEFVHHRMRDMHTIDYNLSLLEPLGIHDLAPAVYLQPPAASAEKAAALCRAANIDHPFVIFHPGSARAEKFWGPHRWAHVIQQVRAKWNVAVALTGGTSELERTHLTEIKTHLPQAIVDLSGKTDLLTLTALIAQARLLVTVDSAPMHLAAAMRTPQVILFGPTNPFHWHPRNSSALILQGDSAAPVTQFVTRQSRLPMKLISTQTVISAIDSLLATPPAQAL
jgi:predicted lipopolysaccharide heptosyltransferase III